MCIFRNRCIHGDIIMRRVIYNHYKNKAIHIIEFKKFLSLEAVSYTHLTLPTTPYV